MHGSLSHFLFPLLIGQILPIFFLLPFPPSSFLRRYLVLNDTMWAVSKSIKCETCQRKKKKKKKTITIERHVLVDSNFCTHFSRLLYFDTDYMVSFYTNYFFHLSFHRLITRFRFGQIFMVDSMRLGNWVNSRETNIIHLSINNYIMCICNKNQ